MPRWVQLSLAQGEVLLCTSMLSVHVILKSCGKLDFKALLPFEVRERYLVSEFHR